MSNACRCYSNYIFILDLIPGFNGLSKDNCKTREKTSKFLDLVRLILEVWQLSKYSGKTTQSVQLQGSLIQINYDNKGPHCVDMVAMDILTASYVPQDYSSRKVCKIENMDIHNGLHILKRAPYPLQWRHNEHNVISNHCHLNCLLNCLFRHRSKKTSKLCIAGLCEGNSLVTSEFPAQRPSHGEIFHLMTNHALPEQMLSTCPSQFISDISHWLIKVKATLLNSLWPCDVICQHRSESTLAQVMACCLTAPSHYLNQFWLIISKVQSHEGNFTRDTSAINYKNQNQNYLFKI